MQPAVRNNVRYYRDLLDNLVRREFRGRYRATRLGVAWAVVHPMLQLAVFFFVFRFIFSYRIPSYTSFIFSGIIAWNWFTVSLNTSVATIKSNPDLISQPGFPNTILPIVSVTTSLINFAIALPLLFLLATYEGAPLNLSLLFLPIVLLVQYTFTLAFAFIAAALNVYVRDVQQFLGIFLQLYFFVTPIFYDVASIPEAYQRFFMLNPMAQLLEAYRDVMLHGEIPGRGLLYVCMVSLAVLAAAIWQYRRASFRFIEEI